MYASGGGGRYQAYIYCIIYSSNTILQYLAKVQTIAKSSGMRRRIK